MLWYIPILGLFFGVRPSRAQQVSMLNITAADQPGFPAACITVLNQVVTCDPKILEAGRGGGYANDQTLAAVCTTACATSLSTWTRRVVGACGTSRYTSGQASILAAYMAESLVENYSVLCVKNPWVIFPKFNRHTLCLLKSGQVLTAIPSTARDSFAMLSSEVPFWPWSQLQLGVSAS